MLRKVTLLDRRGFFAALTTAFASLSAKRKPKLKTFYVDTDSVVSNRALDDDELRLLFKIHAKSYRRKWVANGLYGKIAAADVASYRRI